jgi:Fe-S-cluster containining protein
MNSVTTPRRAGRVADFLADIRRRLASEARSSVRTFANQVPCGSCNACCWHPHIHVDPAGEPEENIVHLATEPHPAGGLALTRREDGACIHPGENGRCSIYPHRPRGCRVYDCRL